MRVLVRFVVPIFAAVWCGAAAAWADPVCENIKAIVQEAPTEFVNVQGDALSSPKDGILVFAGMRAMSNDGTCAVAQVSDAGRRYSTSYTCTGFGPDTEAGMQALMIQMRDCLGVVEWVEQRAEQPGNRFSQYGLLRLSVSRNGDYGLALGVEAFRDEHGEVMGSPHRGDRTEADGSQRCTPRTPAEIAAMFARYGALPGATPFENKQFTGFTNQVSSPLVSFVTKPNHPAHPAIIARSLIETNNGTTISAAGDFAGDCEAFHALIEEVEAMNKSLRKP